MEPLARGPYWDDVYRSRAPDEVSWHQDTPDSSLQLLAHTGVGEEAAIIDVGGGASRLVDHLLERGYRDVTVLDLSAEALEQTRDRLGDQDVALVHADITTVALDRTFDVWHDRAAFHFLVEEADRARYREVLAKAVRPGGHVIVATFAHGGPDRCSGLPVARYSPETLAEALGDGLELVETWDEDHETPGGVTQRFVFCRFRRV